MFDWLDYVTQEWAWSLHDMTERGDQNGAGTSDPNGDMQELLRDFRSEMNDLFGGGILRPISDELLDPEFVMILCDLLGHSELRKMFLAEYLTMMMVGLSNIIGSSNVRPGYASEILAKYPELLNWTRLSRFYNWTRAEIERYEDKLHTDCLIRNYHLNGRDVIPLTMVREWLADNGLMTCLCADRYLLHPDVVRTLLVEYIGSPESERDRHYAPAGLPKMFWARIARGYPELCLELVGMVHDGRGDGLPPVRWDVIMSNNDHITDDMVEEHIDELPAIRIGHALSQPRVTEEYIRSFVSGPRYERMSSEERDSLWWMITGRSRLSAEFISDFAEHLDWHSISACHDLTPDLLRAHADKVIWTRWTMNNPTHTEYKSILAEFEDALDWGYVAALWRLDREDIMEHWDRLDMDLLMTSNSHAEVTEPIIIRWLDTRPPKIDAPTPPPGRSNVQ